MLENFLLQIGMHCGTLKNFNTAILEDVRKNDYQHWYFLTPIKCNDKASGLKECTVQMAYPFLAANGEISEESSIKRISDLVPGYEAELLKVLRVKVIVPSFTLSVIPFWANDKGTERNERKDFAQTRIHIINASVTINFRESWLNCNCN
jgi:hypothetical protein